MNLLIVVSSVFAIYNNFFAVANYSDQEKCDILNSLMTRNKLRVEEDVLYDRPGSNFHQVKDVYVRSGNRVTVENFQLKLQQCALLINYNYANSLKSITVYLLKFLGECYDLRDEEQTMADGSRLQDCVTYLKWSVKRSRDLIKHLRSALTFVEGLAGEANHFILPVLNDFDLMAEGLTSTEPQYNDRSAVENDLSTIAGSMISFFNDRLHGLLSDFVIQVPDIGCRILRETDNTTKMIPHGFNDPAAKGNYNKHIGRNEVPCVSYANFLSRRFDKTVRDEIKLRYTTLGFTFDESTCISTYNHDKNEGSSCVPCLNFKNK